MTALCIAQAEEQNPAAPAGGGFTTTDASEKAFIQPGPLANDKQRKSFQDGFEALAQKWVLPFLNGGPWGRGPLSNGDACVSCHVGSGRGRVPAAVNDPVRSMVVRMSVPGKTAQSAPLPHPIYGEQLNFMGVEGQVYGEGETFIRWTDKSVTFADGETTQLRAPVFEFKELAHGPLEKEVMTSVRIAPQLVGLGLLEAVADETLVALAAKPKPHGIAGKPNRVWDMGQKKMMLGRFGLKANQPSLPQQIMAAFHQDLGVTSELFPEENCTERQHSCKGMMPGGRPELFTNQFSPLLFFLRTSAVPAQRDVDNGQVKRGAELFAAAACSVCHVPELKTGATFPVAALTNQVIHPYTDLLLHDMGEDLSDGRPDFEANGREWRTVPLWGLGLVAKVSGATDLLHDGRARNATEAILWHGGEGAFSRDAFLRMSKEDRTALLKFLDSL